MMKFLEALDTAAAVLVIKASKTEFLLLVGVFVAEAITVVPAEGWWGAIAYAGGRAAVKLGVVFNDQREREGNDFAP